MCQKNVEEPCPKLTQQYSTGWMEKNWKAYLHAMLMISSGEAQNFKQTVVQEIRLEKKKARHFNIIGMELFSDYNTILLHQSRYG